MEQNTVYQYKANNSGSYNELAAYAVSLAADVSLYPELQTIVIDGKAAQDVGKYIDDHGLDIHIAPIEVDYENLGEVTDNEATDPGTLRKIIHYLLNRWRSIVAQHENDITKITNERDVARNDRDIYQRWYRERGASEDRVKSQVKAIAALLNSIFPDSK